MINDWLKKLNSTHVAKCSQHMVCLIAFVCGGMVLPAKADDSAAESEGWVEDFLQKIGADGEFDADKIIDFSILPGPFYNPEMDFGIGFSAVGLYQVDSEDKVSELSSLVINGLASTNGALGVGIENKTFFNQDQQRLFINVDLFDIPDVYYGQGYDDNHLDNNQVDFNSRTLRFHPSFHHRISAASFVGIGVDVQYAKSSDINALDSVVDIDYLQQTSLSVGANLMINRDTRDNVLNPQTGSITQLDIGIYRQQFGGDNDFEVYDLLHSHYIPILDGDTLAWQVRGRFTHGDVPWDQLSKLGGGHLLRGYTSGRYRDKQMMLTQVEYRQNLAGRHGMVYWLGAGTIAETVADFGHDNILPNVGIGYRFEVKPRVNLRLDLAFGDGDNGFYFNVNEAF